MNNIQSESELITDEVPEPSETDFNDSPHPVFVSELPPEALISPMKHDEGALEDSEDQLDEISPLRNMRAVGHIGIASTLNIILDGSVQASYRGRDYQKSIKSRNAHIRSKSLAKNMKQIQTNSKGIKQLREVESQSNFFTNERSEKPLIG